MPAFQEKRNEQLLMEAASSEAFICKDPISGIQNDSLYKSE